MERKKNTVQNKEPTVDDLPLRVKPDRCELWQLIRSAGVTCVVHVRKTPYYYNQEYCPHSEFFEKRECKYEPGWKVLCRICMEDARLCRGHSVLLETSEVVVVGSANNVDLHVFSKKNDETFSVRVHRSYKDWMKRALDYIEKYGMDARPDWQPTPEPVVRLKDSRIIDA